MKAYEFFGTLPGLLALAAAALLLILISVIRRLRSRAKAAAKPPPESRGGLAGSASEPGLPRWLEAAVAAYLASEAETAPSAAAWRPSVERLDPWLISRRKTGVYK